MNRDVFSAAEYQISSTNRIRIPVSSGVTLGATIVRPLSNGRFPILVWYDPYRNGMHGEADEKARYFAERGYVFVYLHVRGTGNSSGFSTDEYTIHETQDCVEAISWLAAQPWSTGKVGMFGASYSGFTTLQVAAEAPPELKAIAPAYFTDRRYTDDCHYKGGCLRGYYDFLNYGLAMVGRNAMPPIPAAVGATWSDDWQERLEKSEPYILKWLSHQTEDSYWDVGSIAGRYHEIKAATMLIAGWHDGYVNPPFRVFDQLEAPRKLLAGPWSHTYPHQSHCGPRIDIYFELLRWWDYWLKGLENGVETEPAVQIYEREFEEPIVNRTNIAGCWRSADKLPTEKPHTLFLANGRSSLTPPTGSGSATVPYLPAASRNGGMWDAGTAFMLSGEQSTDSAKAINFITEPLTADLSILGMPTFMLHVSSDAPVMPVAVRLLEVTPDGTQVLVTKGILNATRRFGMEHPAAIVPGEVMALAYHLEGTAWRFQKGNQIQVSINGSDFPNVWPTPYSGSITVHWGSAHQSQLCLPVWDGGDELPFDYRPSVAEIRPFGTVESPWQIIHDVLEDRYRLKIERASGEMSVSQRAPAQTWIRGTHLHSEEWPGVKVVTEAVGTMTSDEKNLYVTISLNVLLNNALYFQKQWSGTIKRQLL